MSLPHVDPPYEQFCETCRQLGIELAEEQYARLLRYAALVREWNRKFNLVSRRDTDRIVSYHLTDSLAVQSLLPTGARICDIGSGAGLPGIPLAIARPDLTVLLIESTQKRGQFLRQALAELAITNAEVYAARSESLPSLLCDAVVSRLTGPTEDVLAHSAHHLKPSGTIVLYKNQASETPSNRTVRALQKLKLNVLRTEDVRLPGTDITRRFVVVGRTQ